MIKSASISIGILILCGASYWLGVTNTAITPPTTATPQSPTLDIQILVAELTKLRAENQSLLQELALLNNLPKNDTVVSTANIDAPTEEHVIKQTTIDEQYKTLKRADAFASYTTDLTVNGISLAKDMEEKFQTEQVDYDWAPEYQEKLGELFAMDSQLLAAEPEAIACKTHRCQIKIRVTDSEQANLLTAAFSSALETNKINIEKTDVIAAPDFSQGYLNLYIAKNNQTTLYE